VDICQSRRDIQLRTLAKVENPAADVYQRASGGRFAAVVTHRAERTAAEAPRAAGTLEGWGRKPDYTERATGNHRKPAGWNVASVQEFLGRRRQHLDGAVWLFDGKTEEVRPPEAALYWWPSG